jgi:hypothetical protein
VKVITKLAVIVTGPAIALATVLTPLPAHADTDGFPLCYNDGTMQCVRIQNNNDVVNNPIINGNNINGPAENVLALSDVKVAGGDRVTINFGAGNCVGVSAQDNKQVLVKACSGPGDTAYGTLWTQILVGNGSSEATFHNNRASNATGLDLCLSGAANGKNLVVVPCGGPAPNHQEYRPIA